MIIVRMDRFGRTLTDRADGQKAFDTIVNEFKGNIALDFSEVMSLGSSFGDEVVMRIAMLQNNRILEPVVVASSWDNAHFFLCANVTTSEKIRVYHDS